MLATRNMLAGLMCLALALIAPRSADANLITNPGFETGDFSGWTFGGATGSLLGVDNESPFSGSFAAFFSGGSFITQDFAALPGATLDLSFQRSQHTRPNIPIRNAFFVSLNGNSFGGFLTNLPNSDYELIHLVGTASSSGINTLNFTLGNTGGFWQLDDISVTARVAAVPEPSSWLMFGAAFAGLVVATRWRQAIAAA